LRIYGQKNGLVLDQDHELLLRLPGSRYKSYADKFIPPAQTVRQYLGNLAHNARSFLGRDFHLDSGMRYLIESFYTSIRNNTPPPIPYREILLTAKIMDAIFEQLKGMNGADGRVSVRTAVPFAAASVAQTRSAN